MGNLLLRTALPGALACLLTVGTAGAQAPALARHLPGSAAPRQAAGPPGITLSGRKFLLNGRAFIPRGFTSIALLYSPWCQSPVTAAAAASFGAAELGTAITRWHINTIRFQVSQPVLAGPYGAAYAQQIQAGVAVARAAGLAVIVSMQDEKPACGPSAPLPGPDTETAWAVLLGSTSLASDPSVLFELYNEPRNAATSTPAVSPHDTTWLDWQNGGREIEPRRADTWAAYTPVGHQELVDYLREDLGVTNVLIADGASEAERLNGVPVLTDPGSSYQIAYAVHPFYYTRGPSAWASRWGTLHWNYAVLATAWNYAADGCGTAQETMAPQFLGYMRTRDIGVIGFALDNFAKGDLVADSALDPTQCGTASPGGGDEFLTGYLDTFGALTAARGS